MYVILLQETFAGGVSFVAPAEGISSLHCKEETDPIVLLLVSLSLSSPAVRTSRGFL